MKPRLAGNRNRNRKRFTCPRRRPAEFSRSLPRQQTGWELSNRRPPPVLGELLGVVGSALHLLVFPKVGQTVLVWS